MNQASVRINEKVSEVQEYLSERQCPDHLTEHIIRHLKHRFKLESSFDESEILSRIPTPLKLKILMIQHEDVLDKIAIFKFINNNSVILYLFEQMQACYYSHDEELVNEDSEAADIMFITSGACSVYKNIEGLEEVIPKAKMQKVHKEKKEEKNKNAKQEKYNNFK